jgi:hypothetical protein
MRDTPSSTRRLCAAGLAHQEQGPHNSQICAAFALIGSEPTPAQNGGYTR